MSLDNKYKKIFSENLNYYMNLKGKNQADIIHDLDINKSAISSWCNGTRLPRMNKIELLAHYLNINVSNLVEDSNENNNFFEFISEDDAMYPLLDIGDIAIVHKQNDIENGSTYLIKLNNKNTIRKIVFSENKEDFELIAMNPCYKNQRYFRNEFYQIEILGKVVKAENTSAFKKKMEE